MQLKSKIRMRKLSTEILNKKKSSHCIVPYVHNKINSGRIHRKPVIVVTGEGLSTDKNWQMVGKG